MAGDGDREVARYLRREVAAHAPWYRRDAGRLGDLSAVPLLSLDEIEDPGAFVLRPDWRSLARGGGLGLSARIALSALGGRHERRARQLTDHRYKPVHWVLQAGIPVGSSAADLDRLACHGARWLEHAGVGPADVLISVVPAGADLAFWELVLGARQAGVSALYLPAAPAAAEVARLCPTVLAGRPFDLVRLLAAARAEGNPLAGVHTVLVVGEPLEDALRSKLESLLDEPAAAAVAAWAPPGVRAVWTECRPGAEAASGSGTALHTSPDAEVLEIVDPLSGTEVPPGADGEVVWTALGWYGTVFLRLRTGVFASLEPGPCPACRGPGPLLIVASDTPAFLDVLDRHAAVTGWQAELRTVAGREELLVFLSLAPGAGDDVPAVVAELDRQLSATQYVVLDAAALDARLAAHDDRRVADLRLSAGS